MIKNPGGNITFWTILYLIAGTYITYGNFAEGKTGMGFVFAMLPVGCALIWLDIREAKWLVVVYLGIATLGAVAALMSIGWNLRIALQGATAVYSAFEFVQWNGNPNVNRDQS